MAPRDGLSLDPRPGQRRPRARDSDAATEGEADGVTYSDIPRLLTMALVWAVLLAWHFLAGQGGCVAAIVLVALLALVLLLSSSEIALARRQTFLDATLEPSGSLVRLLGHPYLLIARMAVKSLLLALFLVASALTLAPRQWSLMFAVVLLAGLLLPRFYGILAGQVRERYRYATARRWTLWSSVTLLWLEALLVLVFSGGESFSGVRWQEVIVHGARVPDIHCAWVAQLAALLSALDALGFWSVQNLQRSLADLPQVLVAGFGLAAAAALAFLRAYCFGLALVGVVARPWALWRPGADGG